MNPVIVVLVLVVVAIIFFLAGRQSYKNSVARELEWYETMYLEKSGATTSVPNANPYRLLSIDGGKTWLAIDEKRNILGLAEKVYPGLLAHLKGMDPLIAYVEKHGPIGYHPITNEEIKLLEDAGFEVKTK